MIAWLPSAGGPLRVLECMAGHVLSALPCGTTFEGAIFAVVRRASRLSASRGPQKWPTALYGHVRGETPCPHYPLPNGWARHCSPGGLSYGTCGNVQISTDFE